MSHVRTRLLSALVVAFTGILAIALAVPAHAAERPRDPEGAKHQLDAKGSQVPNNVAGWWVDQSTQQLVVNVVGPRNAASDQFTAELPRCVRRP